jgi:hypothetical protein
MEYVDANDHRTHRVVQPLTVRRRSGELMLVAHCQLRSGRRTFKLDRIVRLTRYDPDTQLLPTCDDISEPDEPPSSPSPGTPGEGRGEGFAQSITARDDRFPAEPLLPYTAEEGL